jgi:vancomycin resistance protein VanW
VPTDRRDAWLAVKIAAHRTLRYARWTWEGAGYARRRRARPGPTFALAESRSRLVRDASRARLEMADGKIRNLQLGAAALDGIVIDPGEILSFWYLVGEPTLARGFRRGMEVRSGCIVPSIGGGLCQLASALFEVALRAGLTVVEHHAHSLELAPEPDRIRPFGMAAAVLYPYRDVRIKNELDQPVTLDARCEATSLVLGAKVVRAPTITFALEERAYRALRVGGRCVRRGELWQIRRDATTQTTLDERMVLAAEVAVMEQMPDHHCYTCDRVCPNAIGPDDLEARAVRQELGLPLARRV